MAASGDIGKLTDANISSRSATGPMGLAATAMEFGERVPDYPGLLEAVSRRAAEITGDCAAIWLLSENGEWLDPVAAYHADSRVREGVWARLEPIRQRSHSGLWKQIAGERRTIRLPANSSNAVGEPSSMPAFLADLSPQHLVTAMAGAPLVSREKVLGVLLLLRVGREGLFTPEDEAHLRVVAGLAAPAIANARLLEDSARRLDYLAALRTIDMAITASFDLRVTLEVYLDQVTGRLGVDAADVLLFDPTTYTLNFAGKRGFRTRALQHTRLSVGEGYAGQAAIQRRLIAVPDLSKAPGSFTRSPMIRDEGFASYFAIPLLARREVKGILEVFHRKPLEPDQDWLDFLEAAAMQGGLAIESADLFERLQQRNVELALAYDATLEGWARALELRDQESEGHTRRVAELAVRLARACGVGEADLIHIRRGALLHDIGKMGIPDSILLKPAPLTDGEREVMRRHPQHAYDLLSPMSHLQRALDIPHYHHERWDGSGYPNGLKGEDIPLSARIFAVVDVWDALRSERPYRSAWSDEKAREYIRAQTGKQFDPRIVEVFLKLVE